MVLEIRISNFFSISNEIILDMRAGTMNNAKSKLLENNIFRYNDIEVLKSVAIYGANASGKSNIIKAIRFCIAMVYDSHKHNESTVFNFKPFKFKAFSKKPSSFFIRFVTEGIEYKYSFTLTQTEILAESLYYYPHGREAKIFVRDERAGMSKKDKYSFGSSVIKRPFDVAESTSNKTLFVSRASQMDREIPKTIFTFFHSLFIQRHSNYGISNIDSLMSIYKEQLLTALQLADSDIVEIKHKIVKEKGKKLRANLDTQEAFFEDDEMERLEIRTFHRYDPKVSFDFMREESDGTKKLFFIMLTVLDTVRKNKTLLIDELEDSLHPKITDYIIQIFNASDKAQLIFSTHSTHLLDLNKFRKDQIWFANKIEDGSSDLYSLYDYGDFRDTMNLEKAYLQGRFDSIPIVDSSIQNLRSIIGE
ncbi:MAG: ATP-binding protein [Flavobacteriales bacterium]|nr:ATP-binding protein [Flavobacteriales bacterium]